jgi:hypothetical protein
MMQSPLTDSQLAELKELLELAKITEQKVKKLADLTLAIDQKYEKRIAEIRVTRKLQETWINKEIDDN